MTRARGFTLVELMTVVALTAVIASMSILAMRRSRRQGDVDKFANDIRNSMIQAQRRATATRKPYMLDVQQKSVRWCQVVYTGPTPVYATTQITCPPSDATFEKGGLLRAGIAAKASYYAAAADLAFTVVPGGSSTYATPTKVAGTAPIYFGPTGLVDEDFVAVMTGVGTLAGVTVYIEPTSTQSQFKRRRIVSYASGRPRIIDNW
jgi:prepilin-type N-terminal cleavage/methylation domain-containing protein